MFKRIKELLNSSQQLSELQAQIDNLAAENKVLKTQRNKLQRQLAKKRKGK